MSKSPSRSHPLDTDILDCLSAVTDPGGGSQHRRSGPRLPGSPYGFRHRGGVDPDDAGLPARRDDSSEIRANTWRIASRTRRRSSSVILWEPVWSPNWSRTKSLSWLGVHHAWMRDVQCPCSERTIDVRHITAPMRHSLIFDTFERALHRAKAFRSSTITTPGPLVLPFPCGASGRDGLGLPGGRT